jgi:hypothetical protein
MQDDIAWNIEALASRDHLARNRAAVNLAAYKSHADVLTPTLREALGRETDAETRKAIEDAMQELEKRAKEGKQKGRLETTDNLRSFSKPPQ